MNDLHPVILFDRFQRFDVARMDIAALERERERCKRLRRQVRAAIDRTRPGKIEKFAKWISAATMYGGIPIVSISFTASSLIWSTGFVSHRVQLALSKRREQRRDDLLLSDRLLRRRLEEVTDAYIKILKR